ncbi:MAG: inositol monophosphatase family protein [Methylotenera sp.]
MNQNLEFNLSQALLSTVSIALAAGDVLREGFSSLAIETQFKTSSIDPVTKYDLASEKIIVDSLRKLFPSHHIIGEEGGDYQPKIKKLAERNYTWHIDPLDGTVNFSHKLPMFCVSIGLLIDDVPSLGVIYNPVTDEMFAAATDIGATLNGEPIHVSQISSVRDALLITGFSYDTHTNDSNINNFIAFQRKAQATRRIGSSALNLCYTATGQLDGYWEMQVKSHDVAAGIVLVREAGGTVTDFDGKDDTFDSGLIVASNGLIHQEMLNIIKITND